MDRCTFCGTQGAEVECKGGCIAKYCNEAHAISHAQYGHQQRLGGGPTPCEKLKHLADELETYATGKGRIWKA